MKKHFMVRRHFAKKKQKGYAAILLVIIFTGVVSTLVIFSVNLSISLTSLAASLRRSEQARYLADTCAETALQVVWGNSGYTGTGSLSLFDGGCDYRVTNTGGNTREVQATGTVGSIIRKVRVRAVATGGQIGVSSWREVADF